MHPRQPLRRSVVAIAFALLFAPALVVNAQTPDQKTALGPQDSTPASPSARKSPSSKSPNVKSGVIAALDTATDTLTLRELAGKSAVYVLAPKTHFNKNRRVAQRSDFKIGDAVTLHFRRSRSDGAFLVSELDDAVSWKWLAEMRKTTTPALIKEITEDTLSVTVGADNVPIDYTVSDKTRWEKAGKEVESTAFKSGDHVFVVPRSLPSGSIMARAVSDSSSGAAQEKERLAASVHGTIVALDPPAHKLTLKTTASDTRVLAYSDETEVVRGGKSETLTALKIGQHITARIRREAGGDENVWRITLDASRKIIPPKKRVQASKGAVTGH